MGFIIKPKNRYDGHSLIREVEKTGKFDVRRSKGDHVFITDDYGNRCTIPDRTLGKGIYHAILKQLKAMGITVAGILLFILVIYLNMS